MNDSMQPFRFTEPCSRCAGELAIGPVESAAPDSEVIMVQPHPDYPAVEIDHRGIDAVFGRLQSYTGGLQLPGHILYLIVAAYLGRMETLSKEGGEGNG